MTTPKRGTAAHDAWRKKISDSRIGKPNGRLGTHHTVETKRKISESNMGKVGSHRGKKLPREHCENISKALKGKPNGRLGKKLTIETKMKISMANKGKPSNRRGTHLSLETRKKIGDSQRGCNAPNWKGGVSKEPYCEKFDEPFKERVREFFGRVCVECGMLELDNGEKLSVHHVNFDKMACCNKKTPMFVALCHSCHSKTNYNRTYWEKHFTYILNVKYNGNCYQPKEEYYAHTIS